jgi:hypothetical protein
MILGLLEMRTARNGHKLAVHTLYYKIVPVGVIFVIEHVRCAFTVTPGRNITRVAQEDTR